MTYPEISIIVPCYNQAAFLEECLQSVLEQSFTEWECLIINDGSPDDTAAVAKKWTQKDPRFHYFQKENGGVSSARNLGIEKARGTLLQFLDGDDVLEKEKLAYQYKILAQNPAISIVYGGSRYFYDEDKDETFAIHPAGIIPAVDLKFTDKNQVDVLLLKNIATMCATLYRRTALADIWFKNSVYEDYLLHLELASAGFIFHFESGTQGNCLIRMTAGSQMLKHNSDAAKNTLFRQEVERIKTLHPSKYRRVQNEKPLSTANAGNKTISTTRILKDAVYQLCPPILFNFFKNVLKN